MTDLESEPGGYRSAYETAPDTFTFEAVVDGEPRDEFVPEPDEADEPEESGDAPEAVDPQQWIDRLTADLEDAEHRLGPEHRDTFRARVDLATAYRQIGEPGLAVPLAVRNTLQAGMLFPAGGPVPAQLRKFQDEVCAEAGYTVGDVRLLENVEDEVGPEAAAAEAAEEASEEPTPIEADAYVEDGIDESVEAVAEVTVVEVEAPIAQAEAVVATAESELAYEVIRLRFELQEARRTIDRLRRRNGKLLDALREDD